MPKTNAATLPEQSELWVSMERAGIGIFEYYPLSGEVQGSTTTKKNLGLSREANISYKVFLAALHPEDRERVERTIKNVLDRNTVGELMVEFRTIGIEDKKERWLAMRGEVYFNRRGEAVLFNGTTREITEQKRADQELQRLRDSEKIYRTIGELIPYGIWITDQEGGVTYLSRSFLDLVGMTFEEVKKFGWLDRYPQERIPQFLADWKRTLETGSFWDYEHPIRDKNGVYQMILSRGVPFKDDEGRITSWVGINLDISQLKQAQEELRKAREELEFRVIELNKAKETAEAANKTKDLLFATISHELRTPLALILGPVQKRLAEVGLDDEERRDLEVVERNARTLLKHVNDLLDLSKLQVGRMQADYAEVDLAWLVRVVGSLFESVADEHRISFTLETPPELRAEIDPDKIQRVVLNLLSNAFKFTPPEGRIEVRLRSENGKALLEVSDSGPGIPIEQREAIFERFRQLDTGSTRRFGGTGLGLSIVREFVQLHGGKVGVDNAPLQGALFVVELPLRAPENTSVRKEPGELDSELRTQAIDELRTHHHRAAASAPATLVNAPLVLVVEDNPDMNVYIAEALRKQYRVETAGNGREGLAMALEQRPDLIISDIMMPEMSGDQMVRELRRHHEFDLTPIVLLTAKADDHLRESLLQDAVQDYIYKPFSTTDVLARVSRLVSERKRAVEALQLSEEHYRILFEKSPLPKWTIDMETYAILEVNDAAIRHYGYSREEFLGMTLADIRTPDEFRKFEQWIKECCEYGQKLEGRMLTKHRKKNNELIDVEVQYMEVGYQGRRTAHGTVIDVTERNRAEEELLRALKLAEDRTAELESANNELEAFSNSLSHDLRTPLRSITSFSEVMIESYADKFDEQGKEYLNHIKNDSQRLTALVYDVLRLSFVSRSEILAETIEMSGLARDVAEKLTQSDPGRKADFIIQDGVHASGDPALLKSLLQNLLDNAWKFTRTRERAKIEFGTIDQSAIGNRQSEMVYFVRDNGIGFDMQYAEQVFTPFQRLHAISEYPGTGIGLATVKRIVQRHGGRIWVEAEEGKGATFYFTLGKG